jgi:hypothetical protein
MHPGRASVIAEVTKERICRRNRGGQGPWEAAKMLCCFVGHGELSDVDFVVRKGLCAAVSMIPCQDWLVYGVLWSNTGTETSMYVWRKRGESSGIASRLGQRNCVPIRGVAPR